jgi:plastocyanin
MNPVAALAVLHAMRKLLVSFVVLAVLGLAAAQALAAARGVRVGDDFFVRKGHHSITVHRGAKVRFRWVGSTTHDVHATRGPVHFRSRFMTSGTFTKKLRRAGTYTVICDIHPKTMRLTIHVR